MKTIKVTTEIFLEVEDDRQAEDASATIDRGLDHVMGGFPDGEVIGVNVVNWLEATDEELNEHGFTE